MAVTSLKFHIHLGSLEEGMHTFYTSMHSTHMQSISAGLRTPAWLTGSRFCSRTLENCYRAQEIKMYAWKILCIAKYSNKELYKHDRQESLGAPEQAQDVTVPLDAMHICQWYLYFSLS